MVDITACTGKQAVTQVLKIYCVPVNDFLSPVLSWVNNSIKSF